MGASGQQRGCLVAIDNLMVERDGTRQGDRSTGQPLMRSQAVIRSASVMETQRLSSRPIQGVTGKNQDNRISLHRAKLPGTNSSCNDFGKHCLEEVFQNTWVKMGTNDTPDISQPEPDKRRESDGLPSYARLQLPRQRYAAAPQSRIRTSYQSYCEVMLVLASKL